MKTDITVRFLEYKYVVMYQGKVIETIYIHDEVTPEVADDMVKTLIDEWVDGEWELWQIDGIDVLQVMKKE